MQLIYFTYNIFTSCRSIAFDLFLDILPVSTDKSYFTDFCTFIYVAFHQQKSAMIYSVEK